MLLALESTGARMNRLGSEVLAATPLIDARRGGVERIEAVTREDLAALAHELWAPERLAVAGIGPDEERFEDALGAAGRTTVVSLAPTGMIRVAVAGAAGRMGRDRVRRGGAGRRHGAGGAGRSGLGVSLSDALAEPTDVLVDFRSRQPPSPTPGRRWLPASTS